MSCLWFCSNEVFPFYLCKNVYGSVFNDDKTININYCHCHIYNHTRHLANKTKYNERNDIINEHNVTYLNHKVMD